MSKAERIAYEKMLAEQKDKKNKAFYKAEKIKKTQRAKSTAVLEANRAAKDKAFEAAEKRKKVQRKKYIAMLKAKSTSRPAKSTTKNRSFSAAPKTTSKKGK